MKVLSRAAIVYLGATLASPGCGSDETNRPETEETTEDLGGAVAAPYGVPMPPPEVVETTPEEDETTPEEDVVSPEDGPPGDEAPVEEVEPESETGDNDPVAD